MLTPVLVWRLIVAAAVLCVGWYVVDLIGDNREQRRAIEALTQGIQHLDRRADRYERTLVENATFDDTTRSEASRAVLRNETARRTDHATISIDKPWPAAVRHRVFVNPDPASGSTEVAGPAPARER